MQVPAAIDIDADRWVACIRTLAFVGLDFTGATFLAHIRTMPDAPGSPLVSLGTVVSAAVEGIRLIYAGSATIAAHITALRLLEVPPGINPATGLAYASGDTVTLSQVGIRVNETTMEALPFPEEVGDNATLYWDMHITPSGGIKDKYCGGVFLVRAGVTQ